LKAKKKDGKIVSKLKEKLLRLREKNLMQMKKKDQKIQTPVKKQPKKMKQIQNQKNHRL